MTITQNSSAPLVAVVGATGAQGSSVVKALAESTKKYRIRGFTRDASKPAAEALRTQGVEVVQISLVAENKDAVYKAFEGATFAFLVTAFWEHADTEKEISEGKLLIDAAKAAGVQGIIWSGLPSPKAASNGKITAMLHFDGKAEVTAYGRASGVPFVSIAAGFYMQNWIQAPGVFSKQADGSWVVEWGVAGPETVLPLVDIEEYGLFVRRALEAEVFPNDGVEVNTTSEDISIGESVRQLSEVTGKKIAYKQSTAEEVDAKHAAMGVPPFVGTTLKETFAYFHEFGYYGGKPSDSGEGLGRPTRKWAEFAKQADWSKVLA